MLSMSHGVLLSSFAIAFSPNTYQQGREGGESMLLRIDRVVEEALAGSGGSGVVLYVESASEPFQQRAYGSHGKTPVEPDSSFHLGAFTENFVALALLREAQAGRLLLDAPLTKYLPLLGWSEEQPVVSDLLAHTSGLSSYARFVELWNGPPPAKGVVDGAASAGTAADEIDAILAVVSKLDFVATPGSCFSYDHIHDLLAACLLVRISGQSLQEALSERVFEPLGMESLRWTAVDASHGLRGDLREVGEQSVQLPDHHDFFGETGLVGNAADLARWLRAMRQRELLDESHTALLTNPVVLSNGEVLTRSLGFGLSTLEEHAAWVCGGAIAGDRVHLAHYTDLDLSLVVLAHDEDIPVERIERRVLRAILDLPEPGVHDWPLTAAELARYAGIYQIGCNRLEVVLRGEHLEFSYDQEPWARLLHQGRHHFVVGTDPEIRLQFTLDGEKATSFVLDDHGTPSVATRVGD